MASPQVVWEIIKVVHSHPRFRVGFFSLAAFTTFRFTLWKLFLYMRAKWKVEERKRQAQQRKRVVKGQCANADAEGIMAKHIDDLLKDLKSGTLTAVEVLRAFQKKALELDDTLNAITEPLLEALNQAEQLDNSSDKTKLLHGLPVSLKENICIAGHDSTAGMSAYIDQLREEDCIVVKVLKKNGAIPFVRTNIPQTMMSYCSSNPIYGETSNPFDLTRGPGGSSSGEGALIGGGGSFVGIGSDIGGSIRVPAAFCGCYSLKPTDTRVSSKGLRNINKGNLAVKGVVCPIAKDFQSLLLLSKVLMSEDMYGLDPLLPRLPFDEERLNMAGPMRIGYYTFDGNIHCQPPVVRAVMEAKTALEKLGHTLVPIDVTKMSPPGFHIADHYARVVSPDKFKIYKELLVHDKLEKNMKFLFSITKIPGRVAQVVSFLMSFKDKFASQVMKGAFNFNTVHDYLQHIEMVVDWQEKFMESWLEQELDAVICPAWPSVTPKKEFLYYLTTAAVHCQLYNVLNYPSGVLPITKVTKEDVQKTKDLSVFQPSNMIEKMLMKSVDGSEGTPIGIQCVALPFKEETCLRVMREVDRGLKL